MALQPTDLELLCILGSLPLVPLVLWFGVLEDGSLRRAMRKAGFHLNSDGVWVRPGPVPLEARRRDKTNQSAFILSGPTLPQSLDLGPRRSAAGFQTGDPRFDRTVAVAHEDALVALAWLSADVRKTVLAAVDAGAALRFGTWSSQVIDPSGSDFPELVERLIAAHEALSTPPDDPEEAVRALLNDPLPGVRVAAMHALVDRAALEPDELQALAAGPYAEVHIAVIGLGGEPARVAFHNLRRDGSRRQQAEGAVELFRRWRRGDVDLEEDDVEALVDELVESLVDEASGERAAQQLQSLDRPDLLRKLAVHYGKAAPPPVEALRRALVAAKGDAARGGLSLVEAEGGALSVAKPPGPTKVPEG